jgi:hypothetical protein
VNAGEIAHGIWLILREVDANQSLPQGVRGILSYIRSLVHQHRRFFCFADIQRFECFFYVWPHSRFFLLHIFCSQCILLQPPLKDTFLSDTDPCTLCSYV